MKKLSLLGLSALTLIGLASCDDGEKPVINTDQEFEFVLNTPQFATQYIDLSTQGTVSFTVSQPNYGLTLAPTYALEISLRPDFKPISDEPIIIEGEDEPFIIPGAYTLVPESQVLGVLVVKMANMATGINQLNGAINEELYTGDYEGPLYVRATAIVGDATSTSTISNTVVLTQVKGYGVFGPDYTTFSAPGGGNGWSHLPQLLLTGESDDGTTITAQGFTFIDGEFKFADGDWDGSGNWGVDELGDGVVVGGAMMGGSISYSGKLIQNSGNYNQDGVVPSGAYYVQLTIKSNYAELATDGDDCGEFLIIPIESVTLPGDYNGWSVADNAIESTDKLVWSGSASVTDAGWKFAFNKDWAINLGLATSGGELDDLKFNGENITLSGSTITIDLTQYPWIATVQ